MTKLARLLKWAGPNHPYRSEENHKRAVHRREIRKKLKQNALAITGIVMSIVHGEN